MLCETANIHVPIVPRHKQQETTIIGPKRSDSMPTTGWVAAYATKKADDMSPSSTVPI